MKRGVALSFAVVLISVAGQAHALFGDDEARKAILELRAQVQSQQEAQLNLYSKIEKLTNEIQTLRGQIDVLNNSLGKERQNSQSMYGDLSSRIDQMDPKERASVNSNDKEIAAQQEFNSCLSYFQKGQAEKAIQCFSSFTQKRSASRLYPEALYWLGSSYYMSGQYAKTIEIENRVISRYPRHAKAPEAYLLLGMAQMDSRKNAEARKTFTALIKNYPKSEAAALAKKQL